MDVIYEVPGTFRVMLVRFDAQRAGGAELVTVRRKAPFTFHYREPGTPKAEYCELADDLVALYLALTPEEAQLVQPCLRDGLLSREAVAHLCAAPKTLLAYVESAPAPAPVNPEMAYEVEPFGLPLDVQALYARLPLEHAATLRRYLREDYAPHPVQLVRAEAAYAEAQRVLQATQAKRAALLRHRADQARPSSVA